MKIILTIEPGETITKAYANAISISQRLGINAEFSFNGVICYIGINTTIDDGIKYYSNQCDKK